MTKTEILETLKPLFKKAEKEGLWFYCTYQGLWFHPSELKKEHLKGAFIWGESNWRLRNPQEKLNEIENKERNIKHEKDIFLKKLNNHESA